jgi:hypothetical protein
MHTVQYNTCGTICHALESFSIWNSFELLVEAVVAMLHVVRHIMTGVLPDVTFCCWLVFLILVEYSDPFITLKNFLDPHLLIVVAVSTVNEQCNNEAGSLRLP